MTEEALEACRVKLREVIAQRIQACKAEGNDTQARKWEAEIRLLSQPAYARALIELRVDVKALGDLAIYAAQKARKMLAHYVGVGKMDPYTAAILRNARGRELHVHDMLATLTPSVSAGSPLAHRRAGSQGTASTQASSTRAALALLGAAQVRGKGRAILMRVREDHPIVKRLYEA
jgi:hypothetical protein